MLPDPDFSPSILYTAVINKWPILSQAAPQIEAADKGGVARPEHLGKVFLEGLPRKDY